MLPPYEKNLLNALLLSFGLILILVETNKGLNL